MKSLIFGYGITGQSFDRYLTKQGINFDIYDKKDINQPNAYSTLPNKKKLKSYQTIYLSPGINLEENYSNSTFEDLNFITDMDIFFQENAWLLPDGLLSDQSQTWSLPWRHEPAIGN